jgi:tRNA(Ile)-lysidine synthase
MLLGAVRRCWLSLGEPPPGLVVAVSGGPDSVALLRALLAVRASAPVPLIVAHLNHQLRGGESDSDEGFVGELHERLVREGATCLELARHRLDLAGLNAERGGNLEALARDVRYRWLAEVAREHGLHHVATGHTLSDQAETVLHRLLRGTGFDGLRGVAARRELAPGVEVIRPLLGASRGQVLAFLQELNQPARHDASNDDLRFTRNRIRRELLPLLARDYNPRIEGVLGRLAEQAGEVFAEEDAAAAELLRQAEKPRAADLVVVDVDRLRSSTSRLVQAALRRVWRREGWPLGEMGFDHWRRLADLVQAEGGAQDFPGGVRARRRGGVLQLRGPAPAGEADG